MIPLSLTVLLGLLFFGLALLLLLRSMARRHLLLSNSLLLWLALFLAMLLAALFPQPILSAMRLLGFQVPSNGIFFLCIGFLMVQVFFQGVEHARLQSKLQRLIQNRALEKALGPFHE
jgi:hypothetical protein